MKLTELYSEYLANWISEGSLINRDKISLLGIRPFYDRFVTNGWITKVWMITALPVHFQINLTQAIRVEMTKNFPECKTVVHMYNNALRVNINSDTYIRQMKMASNNYNRYRQVFESLSEDEQLTGLRVRTSGGGTKFSIDRNSLIRIKDKYDSFKYVYEQSVSGAPFTETLLFVQVSAKDRGTLRKYKKALFNLLASKNKDSHVLSEQIIVKEVHGNIGQYLENYCPASYARQSNSKFVPMLLSHENKAALLPSKVRGLVNKSGVLLGMDWLSKLPFFLSFFESGAAQVIWVNGKSGCGKTMWCYFVAISLAANWAHCSAIDIKGNEWTKISPYVKGLLEVAMNGANARFVNTLRIDNIQCTKENCAELYDNAIQGTIDVFTIIVNLIESEGNIADLTSILETAVNKLFSTHDVIRTNPETFYRTREFKYSDVVEIVSELESTKSYSEDQRKICRLIRTRSAPYFMSEGRYADALKNEITVAEILDSPMVVYNMNKNNAETLGTLDILKVYMSQFLDGEKHFIRKQEHKHTAVFYEELQRCDNLKTLINSISARVTGSRSNNLTVFLLMNAVSVLQSDAFSAIKSNITTKVIGFVEPSDQRVLINDFGCEDIAPYMQMIYENENGSFNNCFAVSFNNGLRQGKVMLKSVLPQEMLDQFATRDMIKSE